MRVLALLLAGFAGSAAYVVQPGDTLASIADEFGTSVEQLAEINDLHHPDRIFPGQSLETGKANPGASNGKASHVVKRGETLSGIAAAHGVATDVLAGANGIVNGRVIVGTRIQLSPLPVPFDPATYEGTHVVATGESIASIAESHGTTDAQLTSLNHIHAPYVLEPGRVLVIAEGWQCPVPGGHFSNDWGWVKPDGRTHEGIDIFSAHGDPIVAPVDGHLHQEEGSVGGKQFTLWGVDGVRYFGSHMDSFGLSGDVKAGQTIGTVGSSGNASGTSPHLHFEVHPGQGDRSANPYPALLGSCG